MPLVGSLSVASRTCVCEHVINVLTRSTSSEKAAPGEPPWALDMFLILVPQMPTPEKGRPVSNLLVEGTDEQECQLVRILRFTMQRPTLDSSTNYDQESVHSCTYADYRYPSVAFRLHARGLSHLNAL